MNGTILNIQKYSVHDGPGIRTTVFLKGCPLRCWWCHNPESQRCKHDIMFFNERCTGCGVCVNKCPQKAISMENSIIVLNRTSCSVCGECANFCPENAFEYVGRDMTVNELIKEIEKDEIFYEESGGGVTFSGGEPMVQTDFLNEVLTACKERDYHTTVDVSGYGNWENYEKILDKVDLFLYDLKFIDNDKHKKFIEIPNEQILNNLIRLSHNGANIFVRMPIVKGINDDDKHINESINFITQLNILQVNILPYHAMGMDKYKKLGLNYKLTGLEKPTDERLIEIAERFKDAGINVKIGG